MLQKSAPMRTERSFLRREQYVNEKNLGARIRLHQDFTRADEAWNDFVLRILEIKDGDRVFEMGTGSAYFWREKICKLPQAKVLLSDFSLGILQFGLDEIGKDERINAAVMDAEAVAVVGASFDLVIANHMLYHVPRPEMAIREAARLLAPGGRFVATTNGEGHMRHLDELLQDFAPDCGELHRFHTAFTLENGRPLLEQVFEELTVLPYHSDLWVTDAQALVDYAGSLGDKYIDRQGLLAYFEEIINRDGGIQIDKKSGAFVVRKPRI
jgi:ubiquinone/menaquinone biosynthesis C-methylase UbiE